MTEQTATRSRRATRDRMLDAARVVLAREGIQGASVEHICEQAGFTRGAFYSNFGSKDELVMALFERERDLMIARLQEAIDSSAFADQGADAIGSIIDRFLVQQPPERDWYLVHEEFQLRGVRGDDVGREFNAAWRIVRDQVEASIQQVLDGLGMELAIPVPHAAAILMGTYDTELRESLIERRDLDVELLRSTLPALMLAVARPRGSAPDQGQS